MTSIVDTIRLVSTLKATEVAQPQGAVTSEGWWGSYRATLDRGSMTESAKRVVELDARYIVSHCIPGPEIKTAWSPTRVRRGIVVGSVQSGKTASMLGVSALCLDQGVDVLVVLAGTRTALWRQTYERLLSQLDGSNCAADRSNRRLFRTLLPDPSTVLDAEVEPPLSNLYYVHPNQVKKYLSRRKPLIAVVLKQVDHLIRFGDELRNVLKIALDSTGRNLHCVVLDDEADDGSILDRDVELSTAEGAELRKQIPRHIARLWSGPRPPHTTFDDRLFATYVAYTATPQANLLQSDHNPLAPSEFVVALRVPQEHGSVEPPRATTFKEARGIESYYTGGEIFYRRFVAAPERFCVSPEPTVALDGTAQCSDENSSKTATDDELLADALRAYFVAGAMRLFVTGRSMKEARAGAPYSNAEDLLSRLPAPHTMLIHPSAVVENHFETAETVAIWSGNAEQRAKREVPRDGAGRPALDVAGLTSRLNDEEDRWKAWVGKYEQMRVQLTYLPNADYRAAPEAAWTEIRRILLDEVFPHVRLVVINSDARAQDRPAFDPVTLPDGLVRCPQDTFAIFVAGNIMSRGLTVEGLTTTVFLRESDDPAADTQMQMQRWFGYRGKYLPWCRVFIRPAQLRLFVAYHENDEALRADIVHQMNALDAEPPSPLVLQGREFVATRKISNIRNLALHPGATPFVRVIETQSPALVQSNRRVLTRLLEEHEGEWQQHVVNSPRGLILREPLSLVGAAELLEQFRYSHHRPDHSLLEYARWDAIARQGQIDSPEAPLLRLPHGDEAGESLVGPRSCPYSIAAYLRFWAAALTRHVRGVFPTDRRDVPWSMCSLKELAYQQPRFYVGVRFGESQAAVSDPILARWKVSPMRREVVDGSVRATWGTRGIRASDDAGYLGDQLFDYHLHRHHAPPHIPGEPVWRPRGAPGLILFHVIEGPAAGGGELVTVGVAVPHGGPDHFAALRSDGTAPSASTQHANI